MMRRRFISTMLGAAALVAAALPAAAGADSPTPAHGADVAACTTGATADERSALFTGTMAAAPGAVRLGMRFELQERRAGGKTFRTRKVPNFGTWQRSDTGVRGYVVEKHVEQLAAGNAYRVAVRFAWYGPGGDVLRRARRLSPICRQPDVRADLAVTAIDVQPGAAAATYRVTVRNGGQSAVRDPFRVTLALGASLLGPADPVKSLAPGATTVVTFTGPPCEPGVALRAVADSTQAVEEPDEDDNVLTRACTAR